MRISVRVIPRSTQSKVVEEDDQYKVYVHAAAQEGKANKAVCEQVAKHWHVPKSKVAIIKGAKSRDKIIEIET